MNEPEPSGSAAVAAGQGFDLSRPYELDPQVALRPEPFGALAYHYGNRRLTFLRSKELVALVEALGAHDSASASMEALRIEPGRFSALSKALESLAASGVVRERGERAA